MYLDNNLKITPSSSYFFVETDSYFDGPTGLPASGRISYVGWSIAYTNILTSIKTDANIPINQVGRIERAEINTSLITIYKIAKALDIEIKELFDFKK